MADHSKIEWTEATWNPITGCSVHSAGCTNCYAMKLAGTRLRHHPSREGLTIDTKAGPVWNGQVRFNEDWLTQPLQWKRPRMIFVCAHADLFHESVPDEWIDRIFAVMALCPQHTFQVLTKRSDRMRTYLDTKSNARGHVRAYTVWDQAYKLKELMPEKQWEQQYNLAHKIFCDANNLQGFHYPWPLSNVWLGVSVENQAAADERIPDLLATPAAVRWLSCEPLLGPVDLVLDDLGDPVHHALPKIDWVVVGGESGKDARPMHPDWARSLRDQCEAAGTPFFFKQWGQWGILEGAAKALEASHNTAWPDGTIGSGAAVKNGGPGTTIHLTTKKAAGRLLDGKLHDGMPAQP